VAPVFRIEVGQPGARVQHQEQASEITLGAGQQGGAGVAVEAVAADEHTSQATKHVRARGRIP
jgi:hypothetical protein